MVRTGLQAQECISCSQPLHLSVWEDLCWDWSSNRADPKASLMPKDLRALYELNTKVFLCHCSCQWTSDFSVWQIIACKATITLCSPFFSFRHIRYTEVQGAVDIVLFFFSQYLSKEKFNEVIEISRWTSSKSTSTLLVISLLIGLVSWCLLRLSVSSSWHCTLPEFEGKENWQIRAKEYSSAFNPASDLLDQEWPTCTYTNAAWWDGRATPVDSVEMKAPDAAWLPKCNGAIKQCHVLPGTPQGMCLVTCSDQEVSGAGVMMWWWQRTLLALLFLRVWSQGFW